MTYSVRQGREASLRTVQEAVSAVSHGCVMDRLWRRRQSEGVGEAGQVEAAHLYEGSQ